MNPKRDLWICVVIAVLLSVAGAAFLLRDDGDLLLAGPFWFWALVSFVFAIRNWRRLRRQNHDSGDVTA